MEKLQFIGMSTEMGAAPRLVIDMSKTHVGEHFAPGMTGHQVVERLRSLADNLEQKIAAQALKG